METDHKGYTLLGSGSATGKGQGPTSRGHSNGKKGAGTDQLFGLLYPLHEGFRARDCGCTDDGFSVKHDASHTHPPAIDDTRDVVEAHDRRFLFWDGSFTAVSEAGPLGEEYGVLTAAVGAKRRL